MGSPSSPLAIAALSCPLHFLCLPLRKRPHPTRGQHPSGKNRYACALDEAYASLPTATSSLRNLVTWKRVCRYNMSYTRGIKRIVLTLQQRLEIVQKLQYGVSVNQLAIDYGISSSTVRRIKSNALELRQRLEIPGAATRKKMRKPLMEELDARLYEWYLERRALGDYISDSILQAKAKKLNEAYGDTSKFTASKGWIWRFKNRYGIGLYDPRDERVEPDADAAEYFAQAFLRHLEEQNIKLQNIYNIDESTVMWKSLPQRILVRAGRKRGFANKVKNYRITIGLCTNATGTHKLPPLFVCRYERPRALKHCRDSLPVTFKSQEMARVDWNVFAEWLESDFKPAVRKRQQETGSYGKVLLLLDNCAAHVVSPELEREDEDFQFIYLPVNTPSILQPMNQGIMTKVKRSFRNRVLKRILDFPFGVAEFYADYDIKDCVDFVNAAWTDVTSVNIRSSWKRLLGDVAMEKEEKLSDDMSDITAITETAVKVAGEGVTQDEVVEWISACEDVEGKIDAFEGEGDESREQRTPLVLNDEEIEQTFTNLVLWTESQSDFVKLHVNQLNVYYDLGKEQSNDAKVE